jgi:nitroimidazol reductase NimA-like FMN-containing flavoprotein (pyridoxamine 5'-phosphate oxidase superfamily)
MIEVQEMTDDEIDEVLQGVGFGHFACSRNNRPYVVPISYAYSKPNIYIYTTDGKKSDIIQDNPQVCLQVEDVINNNQWRSVVFNGTAEQIADREEREEVLKLILKTNPTLTPAISIRWMDNWVRENREVVYKIKPDAVTGRSALSVESRAALAQSGGGRIPQIY